MVEMEITRRTMLGLLGAVTLGAASSCGNSVGGGGDDAGGEGDGGGARPTAVKVGLLIPQSGVYASLGTDMKNGWDLWLEQHGGSLGGLEVQTMVADEGETPDTGLAALRTLLRADVDVLVGIVNSAVALSARDLVTEADKVLVIANAGANELTAGALTPHIWRTSFTNSQVSFPLGEYLSEQPGVEGVFTLAADYAAGKEAIAGFDKGFTAGGGDVVGSAASPFGTTQDFQPYLAQIQRSGAQAVYCFYAGAEAVNFVKQFSQFGLQRTVQLYGSGFLTEGGVLAAQGDDAVGVRTSLHYSTELDNPANKAFVAAYTAAYGSAPTVYAVQAWDAALALDAALAEADGLSGNAVAEALNGVGEIADSPRGAWSFEGQTPNQRFYLREVRKQGDVLVNAIVADLGAQPQPAV